MVAKATLSQLLNFPCPHCQDVRRMSVKSETATMGEPKC
jgi:phage FluMu protein Com